MTQILDPDWPPARSAHGLQDGMQAYGSTGQLFEVKNSQWIRVVELEKPSRHLMHWIYVHHAVAKLEKDIRRASWKVEQILAISRGGLIPAVMLSHALDVRTVDAIQVVQYDKNDFSHPPSETSYIPGNQIIKAEWNSPTTLVVDDIIDTGKTFDYLIRYFPKANYCALTSKIPHRALTGLSFSQDTWVVFPWEAPYTKEMRELTDRAEPNPYTTWAK